MNIQSWFCNDKNTPMFQLIVAFSFGILLSPWSTGIWILFITIVIMEILRYVFTHGNIKYYNPFHRTAIISASILGWIIGRSLSCDEVMIHGVTEFPKLI